MTAQEIIDLVGERSFDKAFTFTVVRNPWDKVASQYHHRLKTNEIDEPIRFNDWISKTYGENKDPKFYNRQYKMFYPQVEWVKNSSGKIVVDKIIQFEHLNEDFESVLNIVGIDTRLPHENKSANNNYKKIYSEKSIEIIRNHFEEDIKRFKYKF